RRKGYAVGGRLHQTDAAHHLQVNQIAAVIRMIAIRIRVAARARIEVSIGGAAGRARPGLVYMHRVLSLRKAKSDDGYIHLLDPFGGRSFGQRGQTEDVGSRTGGEVGYGLYGLLRVSMAQAESEYHARNHE